tara:strand:+ start:404 stop:733 length:330 start_codon:yes stop_codon:yes gene_type:complete
MNITKRQPVSVGEIIAEEFLVPLGLTMTQGQLAEAMGVSRKTVNELCTNRRAVTADTALMLATVFGNTADFWLNLQQRNELWKALNTPKRRATSDERRARIEKARPVVA